MDKIFNPELQSESELFSISIFQIILLSQTTSYEF